MDIFNEIFKGLIFTIVDKQQGYTIYGAGLASGLGGGKKRYVFLFVPDHLAIKKQARINELDWKNLQTRQLSYSYKLKQQYWTPPREEDNILLENIQRTKTSSTYRCLDIHKYFPFEVLLLHDSKKKTNYQFRNKLTLLSAIEIFNSVFNYIGQANSLNYTYNSNETFLPANAYNSEQIIQKINPDNEIPSVQNWFNGEISLHSTQNYSLKHNEEVMDDSFEIL